MNITPANLGWILAGWLLLGAIAGALQGWIVSRYEITLRRPFRATITRRWYGETSHVCLRPEADDDDPHRYLVLDRSDEYVPLPWLLVQDIDDEDADAYWAPVTDFAPYGVRRLRPWIFRYRWIVIPCLFSYLPVRKPVGYLRDGA
jgi:hypothetical protein